MTDALGTPATVLPPSTTTPSTPAPGRCTLVGAGPGDPELLTLKALKAIQAATLLLFDDLVSPAIVALAPPQARVVYVGKRGGCKSTPQEAIERTMVAAAQAGENVVRLKGGDPFIFGRGGEELQRLQAAGIAVAVVNGITAGLAAATSLGVPLTHRQHAHGVVLVTGHHAKAGQVGQADHAGTNWPALAAAAHSARLTLVIYMGVGGVQHIQQQLLTGLPPSTPVAVVENASLPQQRHITTTLGALTAHLQQAGLSSPAVMVVGEVAGIVVGSAADQLLQGGLVDQGD